MLYTHTFKDAPSGKSLFAKFNTPSEFIQACNKAVEKIRESHPNEPSAIDRILIETEGQASFVGFDEDPTEEQIKALEKEGFKDEDALKRAVNASKKMPQIQAPQISEEVNYLEDGIFIDVSRYVDLMNEPDDNEYFFALEEREEVQTPFLHLHVGIGYNGGYTAEEGLFNGIATAVLSAILEDAGYSVTVTAHRYALEVSGKVNCHFCVTAKTPFQRVNLHKLAFIASDPRFFRTYGFLAARIGAYQWGKVDNLRFGTVASSRPETTKAMIKHLINKRVFDPNERHIIFNQCFTFESAKNEILKHYNTIKQQA